MNVEIRMRVHWGSRERYVKYERVLRIAEATIPSILFRQSHPRRTTVGASSTSVKRTERSGDLPTAFYFLRGLVPSQFVFAKPQCSYLTTSHQKSTLHPPRISVRGLHQRRKLWTVPRRMRCLRYCRCLWREDELTEGASDNGRGGGSDELIKCEDIRTATEILMVYYCWQIVFYQYSHSFPFPFPILSSCLSLPFPFPILPSRLSFLLLSPILPSRLSPPSLSSSFRSCSSIPSLPSIHRFCPSQRSFLNISTDLVHRDRCWCEWSSFEVLGVGRSRCKACCRAVEHKLASPRPDGVRHPKMRNEWTVNVRPCNLWEMFSVATDAVFLPAAEVDCSETILTLLELVSAHRVRLQ